MSAGLSGNAFYKAEIGRELARSRGPDHRDSWRGMPPIRPGWARLVVRGRSGGPDPLPMPRVPK